MKKLILIIIISILWNLTVFSLEDDDTESYESDRGVMIKKTKKVEKVRDDRKINIRINNLETFNNVKKNDVVCLLIGNDEYREESGFGELRQCVNDAKLLSRLFNVCCKVPKENISIGKNLTADQFRDLFEETKRKLKSKQSFFFSYSGHGDTDGSLVFIDGEKISSDELKNLINSFKNDSILLLDACYSGNNEGIIDRNDEIKFKENCSRIYASLAHMTAKEILYENKYFEVIKPFFQDVLNLYVDAPKIIGPQDFDDEILANVKDYNDREFVKSCYKKYSDYELKTLDSGDTKRLYSVLSDNKALLNGNGYFTSFIGYFFAEYNFDKKSSENISFKDVLTYISNKSKQYVEYLAMRGKTARSADSIEEAGERLNQQPKIFPLDKRPKFNDPNHEFLLIQKYIEPFGITPELYIGPYIVFNTIFAYKITGAFLFKFNFISPRLKGFYFGLETGYLFTYRDQNIALGEQAVNLNMIPILVNIGFRSDTYPVGFRIEAGAGINVNIWDLKEFVIVPQKIYTSINFSCKGALGFSINKIGKTNLSISLDTVFYTTALNDTEFLFGLQIPLSVSYRF